MDKCLSYWSLRQDQEGAPTIDAAIAEVKAAGFTGLELTIAETGVFNTATTREECQAIRGQIDASGLVVETVASGMSWGASPTSDDPAVRDKAVALHAAALERTAWVGCSALLFVPGIVGCPFVPQEKVRYDMALDRARESVKRLLDVAERVNVDLCIENVWNGLFLSPVELRDFVDSFGSERLGVYFDVGNVLGYHQHPPHWIELLGRRIKRVHIKDYGHKTGFCELTEGEVPWAQTMAALRKIGYDRTIVAEMMPWSEGLADRTSQAMDRIFAL